MIFSEMLMLVYDVLIFYYFSIYWSDTSLAMERPIILYGFYLTKPIRRYCCTGLHSVILTPIQPYAYFYSIPVYTKCMKINKQAYLQIIYKTYYYNIYAVAIDIQPTVPSVQLPFRQVHWPMLCIMHMSIVSCSITVHAIVIRRY